MDSVFILLLIINQILFRIDYNKIKTKISTSFTMSKLLIQSIKVFLDSPMADIFQDYIQIISASFSRNKNLSILLISLRL